MLPPPGYRDVTLCGQGATSRVFRATRGQTGHPVALKRLHRQLVGDDAILARLKRELEALSKLRHPCIVPIRDVIRWQGDPTIVMDFVEGADLKDVITTRGPIAVDHVETIARRLLSVLQLAHDAGIVHRDIKPQNIRIASDGRLYLLDFGSARLDASSQLTKTGTTVGTPDYMAPELFAGSAYDPRADIYGLGATLFEALTGRVPQLADSLSELAYKRTREDIVPIQTIRPDVPVHLGQMIDRCLEREVGDRYASAALAEWALDNPVAERGLRARRSRQPPCLHCGAATPPEAAFCSACHSDHPFAYETGDAHLSVLAVKDPTTLIAEIVHRFPERCRPEHIANLAERCAALGEEKQRLLSFVNHDEALKLAKELEAKGIECAVESAATSSRFGMKMIIATIVTLGVASMASTFSSMGIVVWFAVAMLAMLVVDRFSVALEAETGALSDTNWSAPVAAKSPGHHFALGGALATGGLISYVAYWSDLHLPRSMAYVERALDDVQGPLFFGALCMVAVGVFARRMRFTKTPLTLPGSPERSFASKLWRAWSLRSNGAIRQRARSIVMVALVAMVPLETVALTQVYELTNSTTAWLRWMEFTAPIRNVFEEDVHRRSRRPRRTRDRMVIRTGPADDARAPQVRKPTPPRATVEHSVGVRTAPTSHGLESNTWRPADEVAERPTPSAVAPVAKRPFKMPVSPISIAFFAVGLLFMFQLRRRRQKILKEGREIYAALDFEAIGRPHSPPMSRGLDRNTTNVDRLALRRSNDEFLRAARRRAVELAYLLPREGVDELRRALEALDNAYVSTDREDASLVATAILESDPDQRLKLELLALEGRMEAEAARLWAERLQDAASEP